MIPKNLFFLWLGNKEPPENHKWVINTFKEINPDFNVEFIRYTQKDIENSKDPILLDAIENAYKDKTKLNKFGLYTTISDIYRFYIIRKYGGIYLDLDTFPYRPFSDGDLLNINHSVFLCTKRCEYNKEIVSSDIYYIGSPKFNDYKSKRPLCFLYSSQIVSEDEEFSKLKQKFMNSELKFGDRYSRADKNLYIEHFRLRSWKKS